jgi:hypothetical protein
VKEMLYRELGGRIRQGFFSVSDGDGMGRRCDGGDTEMRRRHRLLDAMRGRRISRPFGFLCIMG